MSEWQPIRALTVARLREFVREPEALFWAFIFPILLAFALGVAFRSGGAEPVLIGIEHRDRRPGDTGLTADDVRRALSSVEGLRVRDLRPADVDRALRNGDVHVVVVPGSPPVYRFDPTRAESRLARLTVDAALQRAAGRTDRFAAETVPLVARGSRYIDWLIPGLLGMTIMSNGMWAIGFSIVQARTRRLLKRLVASPMRRRDYLLAQMLARLVLLVAEVAALVVAGIVVFGVPMRGSPIAFAVVCLLGALAFSGLGLLTASRARTVEAVSGLLNVVMMPMWLLSGVFFASSRFPTAVQPFIRALPLTALNDALRAVMLEGTSLSHLPHEMAWLAGWGGVTFACALRLFRWR